MSSNYSLLQTAGEAYVAAVENLRVKNHDAVIAEKEFDQSKAALDQVSEELKKRQGQIKDSNDELTALTSEQTTLISEINTERAAHIAKEAEVTTATTAVTDAENAVNAIYNASVPSGTLHNAIIQLGDETTTFTPRTIVPTTRPPLLLDERHVHMKALIDKRNELEGKESQLATLKAHQAQAGGPGHDQDIDTLITTVEGEITAIKTKINLYTDIVAYLDSEISEVNAEIASLSADLRNAEAALATARKNLSDAEAELRDHFNFLEDAWGAVPPANVVDAATPAGIHADSRLKIISDAITALDAVHTAYNSLESNLSTAKGVKNTAFVNATSGKNAATNAVKSAESTLLTSKTTLDQRITAQKDIEVNAAFLLLQDFFAKASLVLSSSHVIPTAVADAIALTCPSAKVRTLDDAISRAYTDETEYKAMRDAIKADPVAVFFNTLDDPCFNLLPKEEAEALKALIKAEFLKKAQGVIGGGSGSSSLVPILIVVAVVVVMAIAAVFLMRR